MLRFVIISVIFSKALNAPLSSDNSQIYVFLNERDPDGYHFKYETSDGISRSEEGHTEVQDKAEVLKVMGEYNFQYPDGKFIKVRYEADENGYHPNVVFSNQQTGSFTPPPAGAPIPSSAIASLAGGGLGK